MADTNPVQAVPPVEGDGVSYRGIVWFIVVLVLTTVFCQVLVWGMFRLMAHEVRVNDAPRAPLAAAPSQPTIDKDGAGGRVVTGLPATGQPGLLVNEPVVLREYRDSEDKQLETYGWVDQSGGPIRLPIDRAKALVLQRGLPTRAPQGAAATGPAKPAAGK